MSNNEVFLLKHLHLENMLMYCVPSLQFISYIFVTWSYLHKIYRNSETKRKKKNTN